MDNKSTGDDIVRKLAILIVVLSVLAFSLVDNLYLYYESSYVYSKEMNIAVPVSMLGFDTSLGPVSVFGLPVSLHLAGKVPLSFEDINKLKAALSMNLGRFELNGGWIYSVEDRLDAPYLGLGFYPSDNVKIELGGAYKRPENIGIFGRLSWRISKPLWLDLELGSDMVFKAGVFGSLYGLGVGFFGILDSRGSTKFGWNVGFNLRDPKVYKAKIYVTPPKFETTKTVSELTFEDLKNYPVRVELQRVLPFGITVPAAGVGIEYSAGGKDAPVERTLVAGNGLAVLPYSIEDTFVNFNIKFDVPPQSYVDFEELKSGYDVVRMAKRTGNIRGNSISFGLPIGLIPKLIAVFQGDYDFDDTVKAVIPKEDRAKIDLGVVGVIGDKTLPVDVGGNAMVEVSTSLYLVEVDENGAYVSKYNGDLELSVSDITEGKFSLNVFNADHIPDGAFVSAILKYYEVSASVGKQELFSDYIAIGNDFDAIDNYAQLLTTPELVYDPATMAVDYSSVVYEQSPLLNYGNVSVSITREPNVEITRIPGKSYYGIVPGVHRLKLKVSGVKPVEFMVLLNAGDGMDIMLTSNENDLKGCEEVETSEDFLIWIKEPSRMCRLDVDGKEKYLIYAPLDIRRLYLISNFSGDFMMDEDFKFEKLKSGEVDYRITKAKGSRVIGIDANSGVSMEFISLLAKTTSGVFFKPGSLAAFRVPLEGKYNTNYTFYYIDKFLNLSALPNQPVIFKFSTRRLRNYTHFMIYGVMIHDGKEYYIPLDFGNLGVVSPVLEYKGRIYKARMEIGKSTGDAVYSEPVIAYDSPNVIYRITFLRVSKKEGGELVEAESAPYSLNMNYALKNCVVKTENNVKIIDFESCVSGVKEEEIGG